MASSLLLIVSLALPAFCVGQTATIPDHCVRETAPGPVECEGLSTEWKRYNPNLCAWVSTEEGSWIEAQSWCELIGPTILLRIYNENVNTRIAEIIREVNPKGKKLYWTGLTRVGKDDYQWVKGQTLTYDNFGKDKKRENCVAIDPNGNWKTEHCEKKLPFICRIAGQGSESDSK